MFYHTRLGDSAVGQHEIIVRADGEGTDGMCTVSSLNLVHHDERLALGNQPFDIISGSKFFTIHYSLLP